MTLMPATVTPVVETVVINPEEIISPTNVDRLENIAQWGQGNVHGIALSPDGEMIAVSTSTGIYLYDRNNVKQVGFIDIKIGDAVEPPTCSHSGNLAFSPDGSTLAISNTDITMWDLKTRSVRVVIKNGIADPSSIITSIRFSLDGNRIMGIQKHASGYPCYLGWGSLVIYETEAGRLIFQHDHRRYEEGPDTAFAEQDGRVFISFHDMEKQKNMFLEVDLQTGKTIREKPSPSIDNMNGAAALTYKWISTGDNGDGYSLANLLDLNSFETIETLDKTKVVLIPNSDRMLLNTEQNMKVRTLAGEMVCSGAIVQRAENTFIPNTFLPRIFSADGSVGVSWNSYGYRAGDIHIWDLKQCRVSDPVLIFPEAARQLSISADGRSVLTGSSAGYTFHVFDVQTGQIRFSLSGFDAAFSADGQQVFVVEEDAVNAYDVQSGKYLHPVLNISSFYTANIVVSPNGKFLAIANNSTNGYQVTYLDEDPSAIKVFAVVNQLPYFSQNGKLMSVITGKPAISEAHFWDLNTENELPQLQGLLPHDGFTPPAFNSNFSQVATFGTDGYYRYAYIWDLPEFSLTHALTQPFSNGNRQIDNLTFLSDDRMLFARGVRPDAFLFWDVQTGSLIHELPVEINESELGNPVVISPDGRLLLALDSDGTIHVWGISNP